jgi:hypothetical protein
MEKNSIYLLKQKMQGTQIVNVKVDGAGIVSLPVWLRKSVLRIFTG